MKMTETASNFVDPWLECNSENGTNRFEDDFNPFIRMPDSKTYICALESKLARIKGQTTPKTSSASSMLDSLVSVKDDHMSNLMSSDEIYSEVSIPRSLPMNFILTRLCPERQALTNEELEALVSADYLSNNSHAQDDPSTDQSNVTAVQVQVDRSSSDSATGISKTDETEQETSNSEF